MVSNFTMFWEIKGTQIFLFLKGTTTFLENSKLFSPLVKNKECHITEEILIYPHVRICAKSTRYPPFFTFMTLHICDQPTSFSPTTMIQKSYHVTNQRSMLQILVIVIEFWKRNQRYLGNFQIFWKKLETKKLSEIEFTFLFLGFNPKSFYRSICFLSVWSKNCCPAPWGGPKRSLLQNK